MRKKRKEKESPECRLSYHRDEEQNTTDIEGYYVVIFHKAVVKASRGNFSATQAATSRDIECASFSASTRENIYLISDTRKDFG